MFPEVVFSEYITQPDSYDRLCRFKRSATLTTASWNSCRVPSKVLLLRGGATGGRGFKKGKIMKYGIFSCIKISFSVIFNKEIMLWEGFYHDFSTKKASVPWTPVVTSPPLTIYPVAAPIPTCHSGISFYETNVAVRNLDVQLWRTPFYDSRSLWPSRWLRQRARSARPAQRAGPSAKLHNFSLTG